jgi:uncharacterized protein (DUF111 family)
VTFHEVGALDALGDVVAVCAGFRHLGLRRVTCSTVSLGSGTTRGAHGPLPVPAPAVLRLLDGAPVQAGPAPFESTTPTGAALLVTLVDDWGGLPAMALDRTGVGAGSRDAVEVANVVRLVLGTVAHGPAQEVVLEANVDDLDPRVWPGVLQHLLDAGAHDAWLTPVLMKKGRPAHTLSVLSPVADLDEVKRVVFRETSTLGVRTHPVAKHVLERSFTSVRVGGCDIAVKNAWYGGELVSSTPEWEDVARAAEALGRPAQQVLLDAQALAQTAAKNASAPSPPASGTPTQSSVTSTPWPSRSRTRPRAMVPLRSAFNGGSCTSGSSTGTPVALKSTSTTRSSSALPMQVLGSRLSASAAPVLIATTRPRSFSTSAVSCASITRSAQAATPPSRSSGAPRGCRASSGSSRVLLRTELVMAAPSQVPLTATGTSIRARAAPSRCWPRTSRRGST